MGSGYRTSDDVGVDEDKKVIFSINPREEDEGEEDERTGLLLHTTATPQLITPQITINPPSTHGSPETSRRASKN